MRIDRTDCVFEQGFFIGAEVPRDDPRAGRFLTGPNQWPQSLAYEDFEMPLQDYRSRMVGLAETVLKILALGLPSHLRSPDVFDEFMIKPSGNLRLLHYPPQKSKDERQLGGESLDFEPLLLFLISFFSWSTYRLRWHHFPSPAGRNKRTPSLLPTYRGMDSSSCHGEFVCHQHWRLATDVDWQLLQKCGA